MTAAGPEAGRTQPPTRLVRSYELVVALTTVAVVGATIAGIRPGHAAVGATIVVALILGSAPTVIDTLARGRASHPVRTDRTAGFTTIVRLGTEPAEVARTSIILAARAGPTVVITTRRRDLLDELGPVDVPVFVAASAEVALRDAARTIDTAALIVVSASAFPLAEPCRRAAGQLLPDVGWVTGRAPAPNNDRYAPSERERLGERVRAAARAAGATLWEPDATMVRTDLVVAHPIAPGRPWGAWLRARERQGERGIELATPIALRAAPADAPAFWPAQMMRTRATAADLAGATRAGPVRARLLAAGALGRELYAWPLALWAVIPLLIGWSGSFPLAGSPLAYAGAVGLAAAGRWSANRLAHGIGLHPVHDIRAAAYDAPGSLLALPSAISRRIRPRRLYIPDQPLLWFALAFTFATTMLLLERTTTSDSGANIAAGAAVANIVLLWTIAIRAVGERGWDRTVYRLRVDRAVQLDGTPARMVEASPGGCAIVGPFLDTPIGAEVRIVVTGTPDLVFAGVVVHRRAVSDNQVLGVSLRLGADERIAWIGTMFDAARAAPGPMAPTTTRPEKPPRPAHTFWFRLQMVLVGVISIFAASVLALVLLGYRPLVITSGSMRPTLHIGDVVVTSSVRADHVHVGDIVSFEDNDDGTALTTHRVRSIVDEGAQLRFETRGDANSISEIWETAPGAPVTRTVWRVPVVGGAVTDLGRSPVRAGVLAACAALAGAFGLLRVRRARRTRAEAKPQRVSITSMAPLGAADPKKRAVPNDDIEPSSPSR